MPSEVVQDTILMRVTPASGKGALGKWRASYEAPFGRRAMVAVIISKGVEPEV